MFIQPLIFGFRQHETPHMSDIAENNPKLGNSAFYSDLRVNGASRNRSFGGEGGGGEGYRREHLVSYPKISHPSADPDYEFPHLAVFSTFAP